MAQGENIVVTRDTRHLSGSRRMNDPAGAYCHQGGGCVVRNDATGDVAQVSDRANAGWVAPWD
ncbi:colicin E5-related ribonuclease [Stenotrophomonas acidaminiphila]|uniref:colicin E5-related ribonuclease n=1 Tax=Stenotrophomonas acidaminiphila TaxID=128780 RepID=UPI003CE4EFA8